MTSNLKYLRPLPPTLLYRTMKDVKSKGHLGDHKWVTGFSECLGSPLHVVCFSFVFLNQAALEGFLHSRKRVGLSGSGEPVPSHSVARGNQVKLFQIAFKSGSPNWAFKLLPN